MATVSQIYEDIYDNMTMVAGVAVYKQNGNSLRLSDQSRAEAINTKNMEYFNTRYGREIKTVVTRASPSTDKAHCSYRRAKLFRVKRL